MSLSVMANLGLYMQLEKHWWEFTEECVLCCMTLSRNALLPLFRGPDWAMEKATDVYYTVILIEEKLGAKKAAAYSFLRTLYPTPGLEATAKAID